jgi:hypothetical protein
LQNKFTKSQKTALRYLGLGSQLLVMLGGAVYGGIWLDKKLDVSPLLTCALPLLVLAGMFYALIKQTTKKNTNGGSN